MQRPIIAIAQIGGHMSAKDVEAFVTMLLGEPIGQIVACNVVDCCSGRLVPRREIREALDAALARFNLSPPRTCTELIGMLAHEWGTRSFHGPVATVTGKEPGEGQLCHIIRYEHVLPLLDPDLLLQEGVVHPNPCEIAGGSVQMDAFDALSGRSDVFARPFRRLGRVAVWWTPDELQSRSADDARDLLGLIHHGRGLTLVRLSVSHDVTKAVKRCRPTFAAAGSHRRFRQSRDRRTPRCFGRAVDLDKHVNEPLGRPVDGLVEIISEPQTVDQLGITWKCLGATKRPGEPETAGVTARVLDERFVRRIWPDDLSQLRAKLLHLWKPRYSRSTSGVSK